jgi:hypothetical protein
VLEEGGLPRTLGADGDEEGRRTLKVVYVLLEGEKGIPIDMPIIADTVSA